MYNPYFHEPSQMLRQKDTGTMNQPLDGLLKRIGHLDSDDLLVLLLIFILFRDGKKDGIWPLLAALVYCIL